MLSSLAKVKPHALKATLKPFRNALTSSSQFATYLQAAYFC